MVWAAEFVRALAEEPRAEKAAYRARVAVDHLRAMKSDGRNDIETNAMLDDMLGVPR